MIIYHSTSNQFISEALINQGEYISDLVAEAMRKHGITYFDSSQKNAWKASLPPMAEILQGSDIDKNVEVAIEYKPSTSRDRIDFLICGIDESRQRNVVVVELKQWSDIQKSNEEHFVFANVARTIWEDHWHPSYQAANYVNIIRIFNEYIQDNHIGMHSCSYLHNMPEDRKGYLDDTSLFPLVTSSPAFLKDDSSKLRHFIERYVRYPYKGKDNLGLLWEIDNSPLRPSETLADSLDKALNGNEFFSYDEGQAKAINAIVKAVREAKYYHQKKTIIIKGGPGSGKSVVALNAMGKLISGEISLSKNGLKQRKNRLSAVYVTANASPKNMYKQELTHNQYKKAFLKELFRDPSSFAKTKKNDYDCILVDEAHRVYNYASGSHGISKLGPNAIELLIRTSLVTVFFVDKDQKVTMYDYGAIDNIKRAALKYHSKVEEGDNLKLTSEFRCLGGEDYISFIRGFLGYQDGIKFYQVTPKKYDFQVFDYASDMLEAIKKKDKEEQEKMLQKQGKTYKEGLVSGRCRLVAGYTYEWKTKGKDRTAQGYDISLDQSTLKPFNAKWNLRYTQLGAEYSWLDDPLSVNEVGCIHTCQGLDMPYCGVIIGKDLRYNKETGKIEFHREANARTDVISGIHSPKVPEETAIELIRNTYNVLLTRGIRGTYVYCEDKNLSDYLKSLIKGR